MAIVDEFPFPIGKLPAQELARVMAGLYRTEREALALVAPLDVDPLAIEPGQSPLNLWFVLLEKLAAAGQVRNAVEVTRERFPNNPKTSFLESLLADEPAPVDAAVGSNPKFNDSVTEPEALLFHDDLTMPTGKIPGLIATLTRMSELAPAICLLRVKNLAGSFFGTGFRIGDDKVLTNHHVLWPKSQIAAEVHADFGFDVDASGASLAVISINGDVGTIKGEEDDDWAVIAIPGMDKNWPVLSLSAATVPKVGDAAYILQHPAGQQRRLGFVRNTISDVDEARVKYITDTEPGSSGSPVLDADGGLIGLHHAGGRPVEVAGLPPVSKNEGIRISRVLERLKANGLA
ncbi:MAG: hypothetical protein JWR51_3437 [Devosia sp.]|uniref:trypsin-like peptidase domain-containing protein n=1 Tax=Devosia sp. TaxID=1871048 RepID=UPI0026382640|nr:trypsin-like peptidase domain-containing protein [Devosia sp.]MDB5530334.1 hypothetical protein [Devosia sp.]